MSCIIDCYIVGRVSDFGLAKFEDFSKLNFPACHISLTDNLLGRGPILVWLNLETSASETFPHIMYH